MFVASTGDQGTAGEYPAADPYVLAVGGTALTITSPNIYGGETAWSGSNGGLGQNPQGSYQQGVAPYDATNNGMRMTPDVSFDGSSSTSVSVYDSDGYSGWIGVYGTSVGRPCWAALTAIADQGLGLNHPLTGANPHEPLCALFQRVKPELPVRLPRRDLRPQFQLLGGARL